MDLYALTHSMAMRLNRSGPRNVPGRLVTGILALITSVAAACGEAPEREGGPDGTQAGAERDGSPGEAALPALAITIDDLPWVGPLPPGSDRLAATARILDALAAHAAPATGFVNCGRVGPATPVLDRWLAAGHTLGNHTEQHLDLDEVAPAAWTADVQQCDRFIRDLTGEPSLPFRYPYLHHGATAERYRAGREMLEMLGSTLAPVTINTGDWILDDAYVAALRAGERVRADSIAGAYVEHVIRASRHYRAVAEERLGRDVHHILLLHANALLADHLETLLARLRDEGFRFIALEAALEDPVYAMDDDYIGPRGLSWLYRMAPATPEGHTWDLREAAALRRMIR